MNDRKLADLLKDRYNIVFKDISLLHSALTHSSYANEHRELHVKDYERLEFLGDAVLELNVSEYIFKKFPQLPEGRLTKLRADIVCTASFSQFCREVGLPEFIRLGNGEQKAGARNRDTLLEDVFEAFMGALYLDQGNAQVVAFLQQTVYRHIDAGQFSSGNDFKTELQEELQQNGDVDINYQVVAENETDFTVQLLVDGKALTKGTGHSKKDAEQQAAQRQLDVLHNN
ncbi:ribonuclease III [Bombilactobacillus thymidiniphilus]|uniref:Ribonuclease 3 n=1 Tax=Bombilactobacillus thymidiniphilus TaxID=2923363 RepID=A0ABY4PCY8_9LACO|nr:ribonuclease III [Bombilactobacillus thymidiniphilus]UQS83470.1 ribonuclease III [Bombilactobacillus thymidiniphilus]